MASNSVDKFKWFDTATSRLLAVIAIVSAIAAEWDTLIPAFGDIAAWTMLVLAGCLLLLMWGRPHLVRGMGSGNCFVCGAYCLGMAVVATEGITVAQLGEIIGVLADSSARRIEMTEKLEHFRSLVHVFALGGVLWVFAGARLLDLSLRSCRKLEAEETGATTGKA